MEFNWEQVLGTNGAGLADIYEEQAVDALYQDHPRAAPPGPPVDLGDVMVSLPFEEI